MGERETWCELPEHLREEVLAGLPLECVCRFRLVCKEWNALISSTKFITTKWAKAPPNRKPWLVVGPDVQYRLLAYCFFTRTWKKTSGIFLSNFLQQYTSRNVRVYCGGSAAGLFLVNITDPSTASEVFTVCNPVTRFSSKLEPMSSIWCTFLTGIVGGEGPDSPDSLVAYKEVAVGMGNSGQGNPHVVEIYDSTDKSWRVAGHLPGDVVVSGRWVVFCHGSFYFLIFKSGGFSIMGFNMAEGTFISQSLPPEMAKFKDHTNPQLLACRSRILVTWGVFKAGGNLRGKLLQEVVIWEFEEVEVDPSSSSSFSWKEIAKMPPSMWGIIYASCSTSNLQPSKCVAVGDYICFVLYKFIEVMEVVVYSLSEKQWSWLPSCSLGDDNSMSRQAGIATVMAFEPRPDMKLG